MPTKPVVPGYTPHSKAHIKGTIIISDSTPGRIKSWVLNENIDSTKESIIMKKYPGATAAEIAHNAIIPFSEIGPSQVIIMAGTNDIGKANRTKSAINEFMIVDDILKIAALAKVYGAEKVIVSSLLIRRGYRNQSAVNRINVLLSKQCREQGYSFLDHGNVKMVHIASDGLHLNDFGINILKMNFLCCCSTFTWEKCNFISDFANALS